MMLLGASSIREVESRDPGEAGVFIKVVLGKGEPGNGEPLTAGDGGMDEDRDHATISSSLFLGAGGNTIDSDKSMG